MPRWLVIVAALPLVGAAPPATGSIAGRVSYIGRLPEPVYVFESGQKQSVLAVDLEKGAAAVVVAVDVGDAAAAQPAKGAVQGSGVEGPEAIVNQRNWWFAPPVTIVRAGQPVRFTNDDPSNHNVRSTTGAPANRFSAYTGTGQPYVHRFRANADGSPTVVTCDIHAWMMAWIYVFDHPHFAQTDRSGRFSIANVPPGRHRVSFRHGPSGLSRDFAVTVVPGKEALADVVFDTADLRLPQR